ncbi:MAG: ThiF family adenylyltransferase [Clostridia bacterium]|nr:ThiF family adenylyltransferase [Clostridia bacterium]
MDNIFKRERALIGEENFNKLQNARIAVVGIGGVGGYTCEMLARAGIGELLLCDFDKVDETNINRQIIALTSTVGLAKVDVMEERLKLINPNIKVVKVNAVFNPDLLNEIDLTKYDYIVDAIDKARNKLVLIKYAKENNIKIITALGTGNKFSVPNYVVGDIYETQYDMFAKKIRRQCRRLGIEELDVVYMKSDKILCNDNGSVGSISYHPCVCGATIAGFVVNKIIDSN